MPDETGFVVKPQNDPEAARVLLDKIRAARQAEGVRPFHRDGEPFSDFAKEQFPEQTQQPAPAPTPNVNPAPMPPSALPSKE